MLISSKKLYRQYIGKREGGEEKRTERKGGTESVCPCGVYLYISQIQVIR